MMNPLAHDHALLAYWIDQQTQYFAQHEKMKTLESPHEESFVWSSLLQNGFILNLFQSIDCSYFSEVKTFSSMNSPDKSAWESIRMYWEAMDKYMSMRYGKGTSPEYLSRQVHLEKGLYVQGESSLLESSVIQLIKLLFYLLVQKQNTDQCPTQQSEEKLSFFQDKVEQSVVKEQSTVSQGSSEQLFQCGLQDNCIQDLQFLESSFLQRICQLPQEVQEYLVTVVQEVERNQILQPLLPTQQRQQVSQQEEQTEMNQPTEIIDCQPKENNTDNFRKIIFREIQHLTEQNQQLKQKIEEIIDENQKLQKEIDDSLQQENILINQINLYNQQKEQLFHYLKLQNGITINSLEQFIEVVKHIEQENQLIENTITDIQERNYELETSNALKVHSINKNALQITKINDQISMFKTKIKGLKEDIEYLDQFVNAGTTYHFDAQLVTSVHVEDQSEMVFNKSFDNQDRVGNVLRENHDIYNQRLSIKKSPNQNINGITLTNSITGCENQRYSLKSYERPLKSRNQHPNMPPQSNLQNIQPISSLQQEQQLKYLVGYPQKSLSNIQISQFEQDQQEIEEEKQKYRQQLVKNLEQLYKQIADLTGEITQVKEQNKHYNKKNKINSQKISQLKSLHQAFLKQAYNQ